MVNKIFKNINKHAITKMCSNYLLFCLLANGSMLIKINNKSVVDFSSLFTYN